MNYIGPTILELGSEDQRQRWLPGWRAAKAVGRWVIRTPGSDLASLACRGELIGDQYQLNGRKVDVGCHALRLYFVADSHRQDAPRHEGTADLGRHGPTRR